MYLSAPTKTKLQQLHQSQAELPFSYKEQGASAVQFPKGYFHDCSIQPIGKGKEVFSRAIQLIQTFEHFPNWTKVYPDRLPEEDGSLVLVCFKILGLHWVNAAKVIYKRQSNVEFGFAYGTLRSHLEKGEEYFWVEHRPDDTVWYGIRSFSLPNRWWLFLALPIARFYQRKFVNDSTALVRQSVKFNPPSQKIDT